MFLFLGSLFFSFCCGAVLGATLSWKTLRYINIVPPIVGVLVLIFLDSPMIFNFNELGLIAGFFVMITLWALAGMGMAVGAGVARLKKIERRDWTDAARRATRLTIITFLVYLACFGISMASWPLFLLLPESLGHPLLVAADITGILPPLVVLIILVVWVVCFTARNKATPSTKEDAR